MFCEMVVKLDGEGDVLRGEAPSRSKLCPEQGPSLVYELGEHPGSKSEEAGSKKRNLLSAMASVGQRKSRTTIRSGSGENDGEEGAEAEEME